MQHHDDFRRAAFGRGGRTVTRLGFGAMGLGGHFGAQDAGRMEDVVLEALRAFVPAHAASLTELAIRYVLSFPAVTVALCSMHVREHLHANLRALDAGSLPASVLAELRHRHRWIRNFYHERRHLEAP